MVKFLLWLRSLCSTGLRRTTDPTNAVVSLGQGDYAIHYAPALEPPNE